MNRSNRIPHRRVGPLQRSLSNPSSASMTHFLRRHWFLFALIIVLITGFRMAGSLGPIADAASSRNAIVMVTLFCVALPIAQRDLVAASRRPAPALLACAVSLILLPLAAWALMPALRPEWAIGLIVVAAAPGTIASAAVWSRQAGGNEMVAVSVTLITNILCFVVTPFWLSLTTSPYIASLVMTQEVNDNAASSVGISFSATAIKLLLLVVLPMAAAQWARRFYGIARWADAQRSWLSIISQCGILCIVLVGAVQCGQQMSTHKAKASAVGPTDFAALALLLSAFYLAAFFGAWTLAKSFKMDPQDAIGVAFSGSQKTLMVGLQVALMAGGGLIIIPMVMYHVLQLVIGAILASRFNP